MPYEIESDPCLIVQLMSFTEGIDDNDCHKSIVFKKQVVAKGRIPWLVTLKCHDLLGVAMCI